MSVWRDMAHDAGYRGEEADQYAQAIEADAYRDYMERVEEAQREEGIPMGMQAQLTDARRRALAVLLAVEQGPHPMARVSNVTTDATVYWQSADYLVEQGLAKLFGFDGIILTAAGRELAEKLDRQTEL